MGYQSRNRTHDVARRVWPLLPQPMPQHQGCIGSSSITTEHFCACSAVTNPSCLPSVVTKRVHALAISGSKSHRQNGFVTRVFKEGVDGPSGHVKSATVPIMF